MKKAYLLSGFLIVCLITSGSFAQMQTKQADTIKEESTSEEDSLDDMKKLISVERNKQKQIKLLNLEIEQMKLQLEREKAFNEIKELKKENSEILTSSSPLEEKGVTDLKLLMLVSSKEYKEAILTINGINYAVSEGDKPISNLLIKSINDRNVLIETAQGQEVTLNINYLLD